jgi:hypothetical protein
MQLARSLPAFRLDSLALPMRGGVEAECNSNAPVTGSQEFAVYGWWLNLFECAHYHNYLRLTIQYFDASKSPLFFKFASIFACCVF